MQVIQANFDNGFPSVAADIGNENARLMADGRLILSTQAVIECGEAAFNRARNYKQANQFDYVAWRGKFYACGASAFKHDPNFSPRQGITKWTGDYFGVQLMALLLQMFAGKIPDKLNLLVAHPPSDYKLTAELVKAVKGKRKIQSVLGNHEFEIVEVALVPEIVGGVMNVLLDENNKRIAARNSPLTLGGVTLGYDLGGGTLDLTVIDANGEPDYSRMRSWRVGVHKAIGSFRELMGAKYPQLFNDTEDGLPPASIVRRTLLDQETSFSSAGKTYDCSDIYLEALSPIVRECTRAVREFGSLAEFYRILVTGGGSGMILSQLTAKGGVFERFYNPSQTLMGQDVFHLAAPVEQLHESNIRGMDKMIPGLIAQSRKANAKGGKR